MAEIPVGTTGEEKLEVTSDVAINFLGPGGARVLGTPYMILWLETTSRNSVKALLDPGYDTVGTEVNVRHLASTPMGMNVTFRSEVVSIIDRRINFKVEAFDEKDKIAEGTHQRAVINVAKFTERNREKLGR